MFSWFQSTDNIDGKANIIFEVVQLICDFMAASHNNANDVHAFVQLVLLWSQNQISAGWSRDKRPAVSILLRYHSCAYYKFFKAIFVKSH